MIAATTCLPTALHAPVAFAGSRTSVAIRVFVLLAWLVAVGYAQGAPMGRDEARTLLTRTSFAATDDEVERFAALERAQAVERLLSWVRPVAGTAPPEWVAVYERPARENLLSPDARQAYRREQQRRAQELRAWWFAEMLTTPSPFTERMTLFWHNHFASAQQKVRSAPLMYRQNVLLRRHALGNFGDLLHAIARDPAMLIYLDTAGSRREAPNENFAREVMELFTLGEGRYAESDIKEAARALTGWGVNRDTGETAYRPRLHDDGIKTIFGKPAAYGMDSFLDLLLERPDTARFITAKLWKEFVSPAPDPAEVERLAAIFRDSGYAIAPLLRALFTTDAFYAESNRGTLVKSPVDLLVGTLRGFRFQVNEPAPFVNGFRLLGQDLFNPPNVRGWPGGNAWINSATLLGRKQLLERLFRFDASAGTLPAMSGASGRGGMVEFDSEAWLAGYRARPDPVREIAWMLLPVAPVQADRAPPTLAGLRQIVLDPAYQLK